MAVKQWSFVPGKHIGNGLLPQITACFLRSLIRRYVALRISYIWGWSRCNQKKKVDREAVKRRNRFVRTLSYIRGAGIWWEVGGWGEVVGGRRWSRRLQDAA
jgi:hypothetical protein